MSKQNDQINQIINLKKRTYGKNVDFSRYVELHGADRLG